MRTRARAASTSTTLDPNEAVLTAYRDFWAAYDQVTAKPNPDDPALAAHMTGDELGHVKVYVLQLARTGLVTRGTSELHPRVVSTRGTVSVIDDCILDHGHVVDAKTGELRDKPGDTTEPYEATLLLEAGTWKVSMLVTKASVCG